MTARSRSDFSGLTLAEVLANERLSHDEASPRRAALVVADRSADLTECRELLAMLGLTGTAAGSPSPHRSPPPSGDRHGTTRESPSPPPPARNRLPRPPAPPEDSGR